MIDTKANDNIVLENNSALGLLWGYQSNDYLAVEFMQKNVTVSNIVFQTPVDDQNRFFSGRGTLDMRSFNFNYFIKDISRGEEPKGTRKLVFTYGVGHYQGLYHGEGRVNKRGPYKETHGDRGYFTRFALGVQTQVREVVKRGGRKSYLNLRINYYREQVTASGFHDPTVFDTGLVDTISGVEFMVLSSF